MHFKPVDPRPAILNITRAFPFEFGGRCPIDPVLYNDFSANLQSKGSLLNAVRELGEKFRTTMPRVDSEVIRQALKLLAESSSATPSRILRHLELQLSGFLGLKIDDLSSGTNQYLNFLANHLGEFNGPREKTGWEWQRDFARFRFENATNRWKGTFHRDDRWDETMSDRLLLAAAKNWGILNELLGPYYFCDQHALNDATFRIALNIFTNCAIARVASLSTFLAYNLHPDLVRIGHIVYAKSVLLRSAWILEEPWANHISEMSSVLTEKYAYSPLEMLSLQIPYKILWGWAMDFIPRSFLKDKIGFKSFVEVVIIGFINSKEVSFAKFVRKVTSICEDIEGGMQDIPTNLLRNIQSGNPSDSSNA